MRNIRADEQREGKSRDIEEESREISEESGGRGKLGRAIRDLPLCSVLYFSKRVCVRVCSTLCGACTVQGLQMRSCIILNCIKQSCYNHEKTNEQNNVHYILLYKTWSK